MGLATVTGQPGRAFAVGRGCGRGIGHGTAGHAGGEPVIFAFEAAWPARRHATRSIPAQPEAPAARPDVTASSSVERRTPEPPTRQERDSARDPLHDRGRRHLLVFERGVEMAGRDLSGRRSAVHPRLRLARAVRRLRRADDQGLAVFRTRRPGAHLLRGISQTVSQTLLLIAFSMMPIASVTAINFSAPLFATLASLHFLKEPVGVGALGRAGGGISRRADHHQSRRRDVPGRRAVRARQRRAVRHRDRGRARHDVDRVGRNADDVSIDAAGDVLLR